MVGCLVEKSSVGRRRLWEDGVAHSTLACSALLPCATPSYHTTCFVQHWLFQPNFLPQPSLSYTGFVIASLIGYDKVGWGRMDDHHTPSYSYPVLPQPMSSYTALFRLPTFPYPRSHPTTSYTGLFIQPTPSYHNLLRPIYTVSQHLQWSSGGETARGKGEAGETLQT